MTPTQFKDQYLSQIPLLAAMGAELAEFSDQQVVFKAPLAANINDKGTGFAGSIASLCLISGWSLTTLLALDNGIATKTAIKNNSQQFVKPVQSDLIAVASCTPQACAQFLHSLRKQGRGKLTVEVKLSDDDGVCATFSGEYVAKSV